MTPTELADELDRIAPHLHTLGVAEPCVIEAAQTLRALEAVRVAATKFATNHAEDCRLWINHDRKHGREPVCCCGYDALRAALARVGGGT